MQISNNSAFLLSGRNEDTDRQHNAANAHANDPKQSIEAALAESKRLIKSGFYKKAFNLIETFKAEATSIPPISHIKLCRRMVICLSRICTRYLNKGDLHRVDHFIKLMNKSYEYLQIWHDLLCAYIARTNPKFKHLQKLLDEASELYEDTVDADGIARIKFAKTAGQTNSSFYSTNDSRETRPSSFINKLKNSVSATKDNRPVYLEDMSNLEPDSRLVTETLTGQELNTTFHLDEFIKYYLTAIMTWVNFFKKASKKYDSAYRFLLLGNKISKELDSCLDPDLLHLVAEIRMALGAFYSEFGKHDEALKLFESAMNVLQIEVSLRINRSQEMRDSALYVARLKDTIRLLVITLINMSIIYEQKDNYSRVLESLKIGSWFATKFLSPDDEALQMIKAHYSIAAQKFERYLKELGEIERFAGNKTDIEVAEDTKETTSSDHFARMNNHLYNKFNYDRLNASQYIVLTAPSNAGRDTTMRGANRSEVFTDDKTEFIDPKNSWSKIRELQSEGSIIRGTTIDENDSPNATGIRKRSSATASKANFRERRKNKLKISLAGDEASKTLTSEKYKTQGAFEKEKEEYDMDSEEEREHIEKLNRNIKDRKLKEKKSKSNVHDYLDVDDYFDKLVEKRIQEKEEDLKLHQPTGFNKIVKNYAFFLKSEKFDDVEFQFASRTLTAKARENLGDYTVSSKYKPPTFIAAQRNEVKIEAQHIEAKLDAENRINQRNANFKNMMQAKSPQAKTVKFATQNDEPKIATLVTIDEQPPVRTHKHTFSSILLKHKDNLGLNAVNSVLKDIEKQEIKEKLKMQEKNEMKNLGLLKTKSPKIFTPKDGKSKMGTPHGSKEVNPEQMRKFSQTTKNTIQLLMETIEKKIDDDEDIKRRIEENKPLVDAQQPNNKFLKGLEELSKSTANISIKSEGKKIKNFTQVVKNMQLLAKKSVTIKTPKMAS